VQVVRDVVLTQSDTLLRCIISVPLLIGGGGGGGGGCGKRVGGRGGSSGGF